MDNRNQWNNRGYDTYHRRGSRGARYPRQGGGNYRNNTPYNYDADESYQKMSTNSKRDGFGRPPGHQGQNKNYSGNTYNRSRPQNKTHEDHMRDSSPDRNDRARPKDKQHEDHKRDPSPDRGSNQSQAQGSDSHEFYSDGQSRNPDGYRGDQGNRRHPQGYDEYQHGSNQQNEHHQNWHRKYHHKDNQYARYQNDDQYYNQGNNQGNWDQQGQQHGGYGHREDRRSRREEHSDYHLSKALSFILRHGAERQGFKLMSGGFLYVDEILKKQRNLQDYSLEDVERVVKCNDKQRFYMEVEEGTGKWKIRANQGHTMEVENLDLKLLSSKEEAPEVIHGTYLNSWEKIKNTGLSRMGRNHIHFAAGEPGENGVISGMRSSCEVMIYINLEKALKDGFKFYWSANNVILCAGNDNGVIPPCYFTAVVQRYPRKALLYDKMLSAPKVPVGGEGLESKNKKKKKKKHKDGKEKEESETKTKKERMEIDESAFEDTGILFKDDSSKDESSFEDTNIVFKDDSPMADAGNKSGNNMEVEKSDQGEDKVKDDTPESGEFQDAVEEQDEKYEDATDGDDVKIVSEMEKIIIDEIENSPSAVDFLLENKIVAVHCFHSGDLFSKIFCVTEEKSYIFDLEKTPDIMTTGKLSDFFNCNTEPFKVFNGLDSKTCAKFFDKYDVILDGTKLFDLKIACDLMEDQGVGNFTELQKTGFNPRNIPTEPDDDNNIIDICVTYLKGYNYLSGIEKQIKDYKKNLFGMVKEDIDETKLKKLKEQRKKEAKSASTQQHQQQPTSSKKKKGKNK